MVSISDKVVVSKLLWSLTSNFDHVVAKIKGV